MGAMAGLISSPRASSSTITAMFEQASEMMQIPLGTKLLSRGGILLCGEPGTGKTLLFKAVAGEAGINFSSISASQFVEICVGVGASRVRALYNEASQYASMRVVYTDCSIRSVSAPAVVFIDELDAVGRQRDLLGGSGGQERDSTVNYVETLRQKITTITSRNYGIRNYILSPVIAEKFNVRSIYQE